MQTIDPPPAHDDPQVLADHEEVCRLLAEGKKISDPALIRRIEERAEEGRREALRLFGIQDVAVDLVRAMRDPA